MAKSRTHKKGKSAGRKTKAQTAKQQAAIGRKLYLQARNARRKDQRLSRKANIETVRLLLKGQADPDSRISWSELERILTPQVWFKIGPNHPMHHVKVCLREVAVRWNTAKREPWVDRFILCCKALWAAFPRAVQNPNVISGLKLVSKMDWQRDLSDWTPKVRGRVAIFFSLVNHLVAKYPLSPAVKASFLTDRTEFSYDEVFILQLLADGESLYRMCRDEYVPVPLTKRMCHAALQDRKADSLVMAFRHAQVTAFGGDRAVTNAICATFLNRLQATAEAEHFWATVMQWFCNQRMVAPHGIPPLIDYILHLRNLDPDGFNIKGRSPLVLMEQMHRWHEEMGKVKDRSTAFPPSGYSPMEWEQEVRKNGATQVYKWAMVEILDSKDLQHEGSVMRHCVYTYRQSCISGGQSIWSLRSRPEWEKKLKRVVTVRVSHSAGAIVEARGKCNRYMEADEKTFVRKWALENGLTLQGVGEL